MKLLVVGSGGREHCLVWKLSQSPLVETIFVAPGNGGTATTPKACNLSIDPLDFPRLADFAQQEHLAWTFVGPEQFLALGIVDYFRARGLPIIGPTQAGAQIESSKAWAKQLMVEAGVPTAQAQVFTDPLQAQASLDQGIWPRVIKADGLAQGKGVVIAYDRAEALDALQTCFALGGSGATVVIEQFLVGEELSVLALTDGTTIVPLVAAQDHKTIGEGDTGPNTGGMGTYAPVPLATAQIMAKVQTRVLQPTLDALRRRSIDYRGVLYAGLMIDPNGEPAVVEFNCRLGDPETQVVLPLLKTDFARIARALLDGTLADLPLEWHPGCAACVVVAAGGYPGSYRKGDPIKGLEKVSGYATVFHAGTAREGVDWVTQGGRVLGVTGSGATLADALQASYQAIAQLYFPDMYYRRDIGFKALQVTV
ncbi:phosphoribosylamine--glycine ligase [Anthocerotibacter panamensis]|uniref:phosphoribosylamine--glycine ligase n=1 Tax=Anthocerotibacter panamensis TaxID=2857077 RepID=UPI001C403624|nr:phosphoribosylamine--glycine ligase [Anthocerotibacter panamensis]